MTIIDRDKWQHLLRLRGRIIAALAILLLVAGGFVYFRGQGSTDGAGNKPGARGMGSGRPQPVTVAQIKTDDMPIWVSALGTATPRNLVTVRSRVDGELVKLHFTEGQMVKQGQLLADIDPRPFQVQLMQASGQMAKDAALLKNAELDLARYKDLWAKDSISKQQLDTQEALVRQYQGTVDADRGQVESAKLQLVYAHIAAPVTGRIGLRQVDPGNQVHASDTNGLAVIAQLQPMTVVFAVPESNLPAINERLVGNDPITVEAWDREQKHRIATGRLLTTDNLVDTATGTIKMKAEFANGDNALFPNQFVNVRLLLGVRKDATVLPSAAILRGAKGAFVYTLDADGSVTSVPVTPGPAEGEWVAVDGPLKAGQKVVTDGTDKLRDGAKVEVITPESQTAGSEHKRGKRRTEGGAPDQPRRAEG
ncbi:MAG: MdtA/MuxA family multidrug efflux RND transporter periplasmic adaptor subunit, partial [Betaproteobacteria bacterium]|nr:MdtA/MuxA family multidrug efflux RND transporter periplasmic adaptor subunit [Betaproteobacteria bacterium]